MSSGRHERLLWVVAGATALHAAEELLTGWLPWASASLGIAMPAAVFIIMNAVLFGLALLFASFGWWQPVPGLSIAFATLLNAVCFHIAPSIIARTLTPGVFTAVLLYVPFSSWVIAGALRDGVPERSVGIAAAVGTVIAFGVVGLARAVFPA